MTSEQFNASALGVVLIGVNYTGVKLTVSVQNLIVGTLLGLLGIFTVFGLLRSDPSQLTPFAPAETGGYAAILPAAALIFVSYIRFAKIATVAEEMKNPE